MRKLTAKQALFVEEYLIDLNAKEAAIRAGFAKKRAKQAGYIALYRSLMFKLPLSQQSRRALSGRR